MPSERPAQRLRDILDNAERIGRYTAGLDEAAFLADSLVQDAVERCFERIAEAARKLGPRYDRDYPALALKNLRAFGSVLRHDYDAINPLLLWRFVQDRLPVIVAMAEAELAKLGTTD
jgi:uncharacterized protein with HEPN domain